MSGHRKAALALHRAHPHDRQRVLAELPAADQAQLRRYLDELDELGFDSSAVDAALTAPAAAPPSARARVAAATPAAMDRVLAGEPAGLVAALLAAGPWPWTEALLAGWPAPRRAALDLGAVPAAAARDAHLVQAVARALEADGTAGATAPAPRPLRWNLAAMVRAWTR